MTSTVEQRGALWQKEDMLHRSIGYEQYASTCPTIAERMQ